jgi:Tfp pilus assembly protein PilN
MDDINLIPRDVLEQRQRHVRLRLWGAVFAIALLTLTAGALILRWQVTAVAQRLAVLQQQRTQLTQRLDQLKVLHAYQQKLSAREKMINTLFTQVPLQQIFSDIAALTDEQLWLAKIELRKTSPAAAARPSSAPPQQRSTPFFTLGRAATAGNSPPAAAQEGSLFLVLQGYTTSNQRLADFMAGLAMVPHLARVDLQVARRAVFLTAEAIEFVIALHT